MDQIIKDYLRLEQIKKAGLLTQEEFDKEKKKILNDE